MKIILFLVLSLPVFSYGQYEIARSTFNNASVSVTTHTPLMISLSPTQDNGVPMFSVSVWNISSSSAVYTLSVSSYSSGSPALSCANGALIGSGSPTEPYVVTEQFERMYMWLLACGTGTITDMRRAIRGR